MAATIVSACTEGQGPAFLQPKDSGPEQEVTRNANSATKLVERDVEAPDVFSATEAGLWDGRPSLGGVWIAHPDVGEPERVIIRNSANGKFVIGALFRRERDIPGPRLQASSDAAVALGMLAGAPVKLNVTALRREEVTPEPAPGAQAGTEAVAAVPETAEIAETALDPIAGAAAAIDAGATAPDSDTASDAAVDSAVAEADAAVADTAKPARKPWFGSRLFARKSDRDVGEPLSALNPQPVEVAAAAPTTATDAAPAPEPRAKPRGSSLTKPFLQIGIFSVESNANGTADQMRRSGIVPTVYEQSTNGKTYWRVVVGPAQSSTERAALLKKIKGIGFTDAYAVTN